MEPALCEVCKDVRIGKILIQTNMETHEPEVSSFNIVGKADISIVERCRCPTFRLIFKTSFCHLFCH